MKKLVLLAMFLIALVGCTDENQVITKDGKIINTQSINKEDSTTPNSNGGEDPNNEEE